MYIGTSFSNDALSATLATAALWCLMTIARQGPSLVRGLLFGLLFGLGVLAKLGVIGLALPYLLVMGWLAYRKKSPGVWQSSLASLAMISVLDGWLLVRNRLVYGDPLTVGVLDYLDGVRQVSWHWIAELGVFAGKSFFVDFGPGAIGLANDHVYAAFGLVMLAGLLGAIAVWRKYPNLRCELSIMGCW
ncbi:MAG TPA: hypothetical protein VK009_25895, partial [Chloroflexota bacterium]|nr:hypothetical protein [Chloroflexota bacterium]